MSMTNCPKCGFFQPEDQFCASCGVNMQKWTAPKKPLWKKMAGNWMFQLLVLFVVIFAVILSDSLNDKSEQTVAEAPRLRRKSLAPPEERERLKSAESQQASFSQPAKKKKVADKIESNAKAQPLGSIEAAKKLQSEGDVEKTFTIRSYFVPKNNIASVLNSSTPVGDNAGTLHRQSFENYRKKKRGWLSLSSGSADFKLNEPTPLFFGNTHPESGRSLGFYFQVTVFEIDANRAHFEVKVWSELKAAEEGGEIFSYEVALKKKHALVIAGFAPRQEYSRDETAFIEGVSGLRPLNSAQFIEGFNDIIVTLEIGRVR